MSTPEVPGVGERLTAYDESPYPTSSFPQSHPNRMAAIARLFGVEAPSLTGARVLELGCADGANLLPMAEQWPQMTFVGIDASKVQVAAGHRAIAAAGLKNVEMRVQNIETFSADEEKFDYIIAHGVFSWVSEALRQRILEICQGHLSDRGIAYISYNALPGWNMRRSLRDMMLYHTKHFTDPAMKVQQARALLAFMAESVPTENNAYGLLLKTELEQMRGQLDNYLRHDILEEENTAFYFHDFMEKASAHGLQYLGEPSLASMFSGNFPERIRETLAKLGSQIVAQEQYMDFLRNRTFRQTLLCRAGVPIQRNVSAAVMRRLSFQSLFKRSSAPVDLTAGVSVSFSTLNNLQVSSSDSFVKAAILTLVDSNTACALPYDELLRRTRERSRPMLGEIPGNRDAIDEATLQMNLLNLLLKGFVEVYAQPVIIRQEVPEKPLVSALTRHAALNARLLAGPLHQPVPADLLSRYVIEACDGTRDHEQILARLVDQAGQGKFTVSEGDQRVIEGDRLTVVLRPKMEAALAAMAVAGFFLP